MTFKAENEIFIVEFFGNLGKPLWKALEKSDVLIEQMDGSKVNKVNFTFRQVAKYFEEIFKILVPTGRGRISFDTILSTPGSGVIWPHLKKAAGQKGRS